MSLPTPYLIGVRRFQPGGTDPRGNPARVWAAPVDWPAHGISPGVFDEPGKEDRDLSKEWVTLLGPNGHPNQPAVDDRVLINGREFDVDGYPKDWSTGPWQWAAGVAVTCLRVEG